MYIRQLVSLNRRFTKRHIRAVEHSKILRESYHRADVKKRKGEDVKKECRSGEGRKNNGGRTEEGQGMQRRREKKRRERK
jgi:hypothetical protein